MSKFWRLLVAPALLASAAGAAERWRLEYFYDQDNSSFTITDLAFPSPERGMAAGFIDEGRHVEPTAVVTSDGGRNWTVIKAPDVALSLFFLNENTGWLVSRRGIWRTTEFGRQWTKVDKPADVVRVYFLTETHGFAVGPKKAVFETTDGGKRWSPVPAAALPKSNPEYTTYDSVAFADPQKGLIAGWSKPPRRESRRMPDWMDPSARPREWPSLMILLQTWDGGKQWKPSETSVFGQLTRLRLAPDGRGLGLIEFFDMFDWPSEVFSIEWRSGKSTRVFRDQNRVVTDLALPAQGPAYLAAIEPAGALPRSPVPGKLKLLRSDDLATWSEMPVDYRAVGRRAMLAVAGPGQAWAATDTGMILKLTAE
jgi:photosystem II stability/assembly factor-like uncharacterized protein